MIPTTANWREANTFAEVFWTCDDGAESLSHDDLRDAVEEYVDGFLSPGCDTEAILREQVSPLTIYGYSRAEVTDKRLSELGRDLADHLQEQLREDDWGDPNGDHDVIEDADALKLGERFAAVLREHRDLITPWSCDVTKKVLVEGDELVAMVREIVPSWFDADRLPPRGGNRPTSGGTSP